MIGRQPGAGIQNALRDLRNRYRASIRRCRAIGAVDASVPRAFPNRISDRVIVPHPPRYFKNGDQHENDRNAYQGELENGRATPSICALHPQGCCLNLICATRVSVSLPRARTENIRKSSAKQTHTQPSADLAADRYVPCQPYFTISSFSTFPSRMWMTRWACSAISCS